MDGDVDALLTQGCLSYQGDDGVQKRARAAALLEADPSLADANIFVAAMLGRSQRVKTLLAENPKAATTEGGPYGWVPLLYVCYGRVHAMRDGESCLATVEALLDAGADPDAHWLWDGICVFSALTGCFGEGEGGPVKLCEHPEGIAMARCLLERGADPNDAQALYNRMFTSGSVCLTMLIDAGLSPTARINWPVGESAGQTTMSYQLYHAARSGLLARVQILLAAGVDIDERDPAGDSVWRVAALGGHDEVCARLEAAGAVPEPLSESDVFASAFRCRDFERVRAALRAEPTIFDRAEAKHGSLLSHALATGDLEGLSIIVDLGVNLDRNPAEPAAHQAALHGQLEALAYVLAHGADPMRLDVRFNATALGWAEHNGRAEAAAFLRKHRAPRES